MRTFKVKNFERFQHYKDRAPPWIKLYNELLDDYDFGQLRDASKFHLVAIWLLASRSENKIPYDPAWVARRINASDAVDLDELCRLGFIITDQELPNVEHVASNTVAKCLSREEGEGQEEKIGGGGERAPRKSLISEEAFKVAGDVLEAMGLHREHQLSVGAPMTVQNWLSGGWNGEVILIGVKRAMQNRKGDPPGSLNYFEKAIARQHAEASKPLPKVEFREAETLQVTHGSTQRPNGVVAAAKRLAERFESEGGDDLAIDTGAVLRLPAR